jgi:hypothetical protein
MSLIQKLERRQREATEEVFSLCSLEGSIMASLHTANTGSEDHRGLTHSLNCLRDELKFKLGILSMITEALRKAHAQYALLAAGI